MFRASQIRPSKLLGNAFQCFRRSHKSKWRFMSMQTVSSMPSIPIISTIHLAMLYLPSHKNRWMGVHMLGPQLKKKGKKNKNKKTQRLWLSTFEWPRVDVSKHQGHQAFQDEYGRDFWPPAFNFHFQLPGEDQRPKL